ncbi:UDP-GlcNAc:undecaprenylphosphate GlcNAc-1-phosphate transferase [Bacteroidales bacterium]|nr:UDP-GlcNAc:undecaprenylphosphate GlcNAc-1-phosphate transferase [Bacteroidales bacterium]
MDNSEKMMLAFIVSLSISVFLINGIIKFSKRKNLGDNPSEKRKIHTSIIPNIGGVGIFVASMFSYFAFSDNTDAFRPDKIFSITILLFFVGLKDDLEPMKATTRLAYEFLSAFFIIIITDVRIMSLYGIFYIADLPYWASFALTSLFIVACINAYNMIDGIDGLLGSVSLLGTIIFGVVFFLVGEYLWALLSSAIAGALTGFLIFNWQKAKIFMGNGGSMFLGTFFACMSLRFLQIEPFRYEYLHISMPHVITLGVIAIPLFDMFFVVGTRLYTGMSPMKADNRHTHHRLLKLGLNHEQTVGILIAANLLIVAFAYFVQGMGALRSLLSTIGFCILIYLPLIMLNRRKLRNNQRDIKS